MALTGLSRTCFGGMTLALLLSISAPCDKAFAVEFKLKKGQQFELCRDMAANLKSFPDLLPQPFDMPFDPALGKFRWVEWEPVDPLSHVEILRLVTINKMNFRRDLTPAEQEAFWQKEFVSVLDKAHAGKVALERANFDANHDGKRERVYRFTSDKYVWPATYDPRGWVYAWALVVMPEDDPKASAQLSEHARWSLNPFYYKGRIFYFDASWLTIYEPNEVREVKNLNLRRVCRFEAFEK